MSLSATAVQKAQPKGKPYKLSDAGGLYLLVHPNGSKYWRLKYRYLGKEKTLAIGVYPTVTLAMAREGRDEAKKLLAQGHDPVDYRRGKRKQAKQSADNTFEKVTADWLETKRNDWGAAHFDRVKDSLDKDIMPELGRRPINDITAPELLDVLRKVEQRNALETAQRLVQRCRAVFRYGIIEGKCWRNPAVDLQGALKAPKKTHQKSLREEDLPDFLERLEEYAGLQPETRSALKLLVLCFPRPGELRAAEWTEFNLGKAEWRIPAERMKMGVEHIVPLSRQAVEIVETLKPLTGHRLHLFPNQANPKKPMSENTLLYALYRLGYHSRATAHGFRATASTILNEQGFRKDVIERQLAHMDRDKVRAAYNRAEYLEERRQMMQAWADYIDVLAGAGSKVLTFKKEA